MNTVTMKYNYNKTCGHLDNTDSSNSEFEDEVDSDQSPITPNNLAMTMMSPIKQKLTKKIRAQDISHYWKEAVRDQKPVHM